MRILLLEDDELFAQTIEDFLDDEGFIVDIANDGEEALSLNYKINYDLYLLDINVPKISGLELLKDLRESGDNTPAIFLTSYKDKQTLEDGFLSGADDYLKKPIDLDELILRIKSLLKRAGKQTEKIMLDENLFFNPSDRRVYKDNSDMNLPMKVVDLLELFLENRDKIVTKEMIVSRLWSVEEDYSEGSIRVYINHVKKIFTKEKIVNIKGVGYKLEY
ncbi:response regulator transcription factor [Arcobacter sp.]|uniref:response regulator transcription factor n=1 Tax=Arcobacter sp. TaxID=1872629 RepID=UPI003D0CF94D